MEKENRYICITVSLFSERINSPSVNDADKTQLDNDCPLASSTLENTKNQNCTATCGSSTIPSISVQKFAALSADSICDENQAEKSQSPAKNVFRRNYEDVEIKPIDVPPLDMNDENSTNDFVSNDIDIEPKLPASLRFNQKTMSIYVKSSNKWQQQQSTSNRAIKTNFTHPNSSEESDNDNDLCENIVCSPMYNDQDDTIDQNHFNKMTETETYSNDDELEIKHVPDDTASYHVINKQQNFNLRDKKLRNLVYLRNPRGNQIRTYDTDSLYAALMDVKGGESIYR